jgi:hypothetical protein
VSGDVVADGAVGEGHGAPGVADAPDAAGGVAADDAVGEV